VNPRLFRATVLIGLGIFAGAVLPAHAPAQVPVKRDTSAGRDTIRVKRDTTAGRDTLKTPVDSARLRAKPVPTPPPDTIRVPLPPGPDTILQNDSTRRGLTPKPAVKTDTIKPPLARAEAPPVLEIGAPRIYDRTALFATGALTLGDLLGRVPGLTEFTAGWAGAPTVVASMGDFRRIRLFLDGLELDPMDRRSRGVAPVNDMPLHALEEVRIERGAEEVRVYARTWRVDRTTPYTRADIATGDQNTNLYRAFFGRRYDHGEAIQVSAEQFSTQPNRDLPTTDGVQLMARFGLTRGPWSADFFGERRDRNRGTWVGNGNPSETLDTIPGLETRRTDAYFRLGNGDPDRGRWFQLLASSHDYRGTAHVPPSAKTGATPSVGVAPIPDSTTYENQYLVTGGATRGPLRLSAAERIRVGGGRRSHVASGRAAYESGPLALSLFGEGRSYLAPGRTEASARFSPLSFVAVTASASRTGSGVFDRILGQDFGPVFDQSGELIRSPIGTVDSSRVNRFRLGSRTNLRGEAGVRVRDLWLSVGVLKRGPTILLPPAELDSSYAKLSAMRTEQEATGKTAAVRGRLWRAVNVDAWAVAWNDSTGLYRPRYQTRSELYIQTSLLDRFPRGNFGLLASLAHEYRSNTRFASGDTVRVAPGFRRVDFKLEIRIQTAVVSYQFRNVLQERYQEIPGFPMPRQTQFYGVRWDFWN
jgi:hypothetical protein